MIHVLLFLFFINVGINFALASLTGSQPDVTAELSAGITAGDDVIPVNTVDGLPGAGIVYVGNEALTYTAKTGSCPSPFGSEPACLTGAARGALQSEAVSHSEGARVYGELSGGLNEIAGFEIVTVIDELGQSANPLALGAGLVRLGARLVTLPLGVFSGQWATVGYVLTIFNIASILGGPAYLGAALIRGGK